MPYVNLLPSADVRQLVGDDTTTVFTVLHGLGTTAPSVRVFDDAGTAEISSPRPSNITASAFDLVFAEAPAVGVTYTVRTER